MSIGVPFRCNLRIFSQLCMAFGLTASVHLALAAPMSAQQAPATSTTFWSRSLLFRPLRANVFEPRVGAFYQTPAAKLRLDIGNSLDVFSLTLNEQSECRFGADFFTYTRLRSEVNFRFPVETTDFFFGVNGSIRAALTGELALLGRFRVAHISAHLVDGIPTYQQTFVYSREFVDVVAALEWAVQRTLWRSYVGTNVLFHTIPEAFGTVTPQFGLDVMDYSTVYNALGISWIGLCAGYDLKLPMINTTKTAIHTAQAGIRFGARNATGVLVGLYWYEGQSLHGMFYNERDSYVGVGFQVDF